MTDMTAEAPAVSPGEEKMTFEFEGKSWLGVPVINGHQVFSIESFDVHVECQEVPVVTVKLMPLDGLRLLLAGAQVSVDDQTREALLSMGWTPPEDAGPPSDPPMAGGLPGASQ